MKDNDDKFMKCVHKDIWWLSSTSNLAKRRPSLKRVVLAEPSFLEVPSNKDFQVHDYLKLWLLLNYLHLRRSSFSVKILRKLVLFCMCIKSFVKAGEIWIIRYNPGKIGQIHRRTYNLWKALSQSLFPVLKYSYWLESYPCTFGISKKFKFAIDFPFELSKDVNYSKEYKNIFLNHRDLSLITTLKSISISWKTKFVSLCY